MEKSWKKDWNADRFCSFFYCWFFAWQQAYRSTRKLKKTDWTLKQEAQKNPVSLSWRRRFSRFLRRQIMKKEEDFMPFIFWKTACFHRITKKSCLKNGRKKKSGNLLKRSVQLFGMISAIFLFRNHRNIHSIRYLLWTAGWESAPTEEKGDMKAVIWWHRKISPVSIRLWVWQMG